MVIQHSIYCETEGSMESVQKYLRQWTSGWSPLIHFWAFVFRYSSSLTWSRCRISLQCSWPELASNSRGDPLRWRDPLRHFRGATPDRKLINESNEDQVNYHKVLGIRKEFKIVSLRSMNLCFISWKTQVMYIARFHPRIQTFDLYPTVAGG